MRGEGTNRPARDDPDRVAALAIEDLVALSESYVQGPPGLPGAPTVNDLHHFSMAIGGDGPRLKARVSAWLGAPAPTGHLAFSPMLSEDRRARLVKYVADAACALRMARGYRPEGLIDRILWHFEQPKGGVEEAAALLRAIDVSPLVHHDGAVTFLHRGENRTRIRIRPCSGEGGGIDAVMQECGACRLAFRTAPGDLTVGATYRYAYLEGPSPGRRVTRAWDAHNLRRTSSAGCPSPHDWNFVTVHDVARRAPALTVPGTRPRGARDE
jgi:hypothetical protein